jgi:Fe2+ or Zn2+ uptake regulation protein
MKNLSYYSQFIGEAKRNVTVTKEEVKEFLEKQKEILSMYQIKQQMNEELGKEIKTEDIYNVLIELEDDCIDCVKIRDYSDNSRRWYPYYFHTDSINKEDAEKEAETREKKSLDENKGRLSEREKSKTKPRKTPVKRTTKPKIESTKEKETEETVAKKPVVKKTVAKKTIVKKTVTEETSGDEKEKE